MHSGDASEINIGNSAIQSTLDILSTDISKCPFTSKNIVLKLVGCFGLNSPLRQYFSLYRAVVLKDTFPILFTFQHLLSQTTDISRKFYFVISEVADEI